MLPGEPKEIDLATMGVGLRCTITSHILVRADLGRPLHRRLIDHDRGIRGDIGVVLSY